MRPDDAEWLTLQTDQRTALTKYGMILPSLPSDEIQTQVTGMSGSDNLRQAYEFYRFISSKARLPENRGARVLDFGGGWGRVARFFLRDVPAANIYICDTRKFMVDQIAALGSSFQVVHNAPRPPLKVNVKFDIIYAYSVFSHLSENYFSSWIEHLFSLLKPEGLLFFTSRGTMFIDHIERLHKTDISLVHPVLQTHVQQIKQQMPAPDIIRRHYNAGDFQFYPIGGSDELDNSFFGETFIPRSYLARNYRDELFDFTESVERVDQSIAVMRNIRYT